MEKRRGLEYRRGTRIQDVSSVETGEGDNRQGVLIMTKIMYEATVERRIKPLCIDIDCRDHKEGQARLFFVS